MPKMQKIPNLLVLVGKDDQSVYFTCFHPNLMSVGTFLRPMLNPITTKNLVHSNHVFVTKVQLLSKSIHFATMYVIVLHVMLCCKS